MIKKASVSFIALLALTACASRSSNQPPTTPAAAKELLTSGRSPGTTLGDPAAPLKIAVFQDTNCGMCRKMWREVVNGALKEPLAKGEVAYRFMEFPLGLDPNSSAIAVAGKCAAEQGRYREFMEVVYSTKGEHGEKNLTEFSKRAGLEIKKVNDCINAGRGKEAAKLDVAIGEVLHVRGTPTFFVNGEELAGNWTEPDTWQQILDK
jgi:protein-disulfide isomerase